MKKLQLGMESRCNIGAMIKEARIAFDKALGIPVDLTLPQKNLSEEIKKNLKIKICDI